MNAGVWQAPGRVNLIGEHTDYNDGLVAPFALPLTVVAEGRRREDGVLSLGSDGAEPGRRTVDLRVDDLAPGHGPRGWTDYPAGVLWALREAGHRIGGAQLRFTSTLPQGAGLSSSAALGVVTALALSELYGLDPAPDLPELARIARRAENAYAGAPTGIMDQMASACCTEGHVLALDTRDLSLRQIPFDPAAHGLALLLVDTRVTHAHSTGAYGRRRAGCEAAAAALGVPALRDVGPDELPAALARLADPEQRRLVRHVVTENHRVERVTSALLTGDVHAVGPVLTEGHVSLRDDFRVSCPELDLVVSAALAAGALGARMTGGGFGGSAIVLTRAAAAGAVAAAVRRAFAEASLTEPVVRAADPAGGARRIS
ncbi:galactokinase [Streptomyces clavuligerus]|uniref:Galactokinase n=1 Tax=Streptomyces clavuligerus TaxID=1901 RepID=E2Q7C1_STRCL|nr:galactokinase [Streptomyces clavuligerus]ANW19817.1 galactokinase [Streptomyces clavuligerus]AXU14432.1 galactokinase [Streptomyces clavuligerus]EFG07327.1 galactokinase [Streptomyces clavuligerus]MBY6304440.1 galactokinase [Streptomyces clavuligerus]QCS07206.1 galactokinase [Streptomyces clavuligerus]